jgi:hypothetical protein
MLPVADTACSWLRRKGLREIRRYLRPRRRFSLGSGAASPQYAPTAQLRAPGQVMFT